MEKSDKLYNNNNNNNNSNSDYSMIFRLRFSLFAAGKKGPREKMLSLLGVERGWESKE